MSEAIKMKEAVVAEIAEKLQNSKSAVFIDYRGLTAVSYTHLDVYKRQL